MHTFWLISHPILNGLGLGIGMSWAWAQTHNLTNSIQLIIMLTMGKIDRLMVLLISPASEKNMAILELIQGTIQLKLQ